MISARVKNIKGLKIVFRTPFLWYNYVHAHVYNNKKLFLVESTFKLLRGQIKKLKNALIFVTCCMRIENIFGIIFKISKY